MTGGLLVAPPSALRGLVLGDQHGRRDRTLGCLCAKAWRPIPTCVAIEGSQSSIDEFQARLLRCGAGFGGRTYRSVVGSDGFLQRANDHRRASAARSVPTTKRVPAQVLGSRVRTRAFSLRLERFSSDRGWVRRSRVSVGR